MQFWELIISRAGVCAILSFYFLFSTFLLGVGFEFYDFDEV